MEFGYRHRAFRFNLLSKERSKGFPLQSLTQGHNTIIVFLDFKVGCFLVNLFGISKDWPIGHAPLTNPQCTNTICY